MTFVGAGEQPEVLRLLLEVLLPDFLDLNQVEDSGCVALGQVLHLSEPQFPHLSPASRGRSPLAQRPRARGQSDAGCPGLGILTCGRELDLAPSDTWWH